MLWIEVIIPFSKYWVCRNHIDLINWIIAEIGSGEALDGNTEASNLKEEDEESEEEDDDPGGSILILFSNR